MLGARVGSPTALAHCFNSQPNDVLHAELVDGDGVDMAPGEPSQCRVEFGGLDLDRLIGALD